MPYPTFETLRPSYAKLWAELEPAPERVPALQAIAAALIANKATYRRVAGAVWSQASLWFIVALIDQMEGGGGCRTHLHNGDPLTARTINVPAGRPPGEPHGSITVSAGNIAVRAFTFEESAIDALIFDDLDKVPKDADGNWPIERVAYQLEKYNGGGYLDKPIVSPYLASWSNKYTKGKFTSDHHYDPEAVSQQPGALSILKILATLDAEVASALQPQPKEIPMTTAPPLAPAQAPAPSRSPQEAAPALPAIDLNTIEVDLEKIAPTLEFIAAFVPGPYGLAVKAGIPAIEALLKVGGDIENAPDLAAKFAALEAHTHDIGNVFGQIKAIFAPKAA